MIRLAGVGGVLAAIALAAGCSSSDVALTDSGAERNEALDEEDLYAAASEVTCGRLADKVVKMSAEEDIALLKLRAPKIVKDNRKPGMTLPTGTREAVLLECRGAGVWSDGSTTPTLVRWTVDSDGDDFIVWEEQ